MTSALKTPSSPSSPPSHRWHSFYSSWIRAWQSVICSIRHGEEVAPSSIQASPRENRSVTPEDGDGDPEFPHSHQRMHLQRIISGHVDDGLRAALQQTHEEEGSWDSLARLRERSSLDVDHTWLWKLNPAGAPSCMRMSLLTWYASVWAVRG